MDSDRRPVPPGVLSDSALVTNLANRIQPIIRYDLGDRVMLQPQPCVCGSSFPVVAVEGRTNDLLSLKPPSIARCRSCRWRWGRDRGNPGVHRFQAIGTGPRDLTIRLDVDDEAVRGRR